MLHFIVKIVSEADKEPLEQKKSLLELTTMENDFTINIRWEMKWKVEE